MSFVYCLLNTICLTYGCMLMLTNMTWLETLGTCLLCAGMNGSCIQRTEMMLSILNIKSFWNARVESMCFFRSSQNLLIKAPTSTVVEVRWNHDIVPYPCRLACNESIAGGCNSCQSSSFCVTAQHPCAGFWTLSTILLGMFFLQRVLTATKLA